MRTSHRTWSPFNDNLRSLFCHFCNMDLPLLSPVLFLIQNKHLLFGEINTFKWANKGRLPSRQHRAAPHACSFTSYQCCFWNRPSHYLLPLATAEERRGSGASLTATRTLWHEWQHASRCNGLFSSVTDWMPWNMSPPQLSLQPPQFWRPLEFQVPCWSRTPPRGQKWPGVKMWTHRWRMSAKHITFTSASFWSKTFQVHFLKQKLFV